MDFIFLPPIVGPNHWYEVGRSFHFRTAIAIAPPCKLLSAARPSRLSLAVFSSVIAERPGHGCSLAHNVAKVNCGQIKSADAPKTFDCDENRNERLKGGELSKLTVKHEPAHSGPKRSL